MTMFLNMVTTETQIFLYQLLKILTEGRAVPEEMMVKLIVDRLKSPDIEHYGRSLTKTN